MCKRVNITRIDVRPFQILYWLMTSLLMGFMTTFLIIKFSASIFFVWVFFWYSTYVLYLTNSRRYNFNIEPSKIFKLLIKSDHQFYANELTAELNSLKSKNQC